MTCADSCSRYYQRQRVLLAMTAQLHKCYLPTPAETSFNGHHAHSMQHPCSWIASACRWLRFCQQKVVPSQVRCTLALSMPCTRHMHLTPLCTPCADYHSRQVQLNNAITLWDHRKYTDLKSHPASTGLPECSAALLNCRRCSEGATCVYRYK